MSSIYDWSLLAASNANSDDNINWQEGQPPSTVNNSARSMMHRVRELISDLGAVTATTGTANVIAFTSKSPFNAYTDGIRIALRASSTNTGAANLNVNSVGAKPIFTLSANAGVVPLAGGNITANGIYELIYSAALDSNSGGWMLLNPTLQLKPVGAYEIMAAPTIPVGYLYCDGRAVSRTTYSALFNVIGTRFGAGDGSTTFNLPDWRGNFMRGWDDGRGMDSGRAFGSQQASQNVNHSHTFNGTTSGNGSHTISLGRGQGSGNSSGWLGAANQDQSLQIASIPNHDHAFGGTTNTVGGNEARPVNNTVYVVVKF